MKTKEFLQNLITRKTEQIKEIRAKIKSTDSVEEVRALGDTLEALLTELQDAKDQLAAVEQEESAGADAGADDGVGEGRDDSQQDEKRSFNPIASFNLNVDQKHQRNADPFDTLEYRTAFMNYACRGVPIPQELRADAVTATSDASAVIPTTIMNEIVQELKSYGNIFNQVRKLNVQGGVEIPILSLKPTATWIGESTPSETKKIQANTKVSFSYYGLECKIAQTILVNVTTLEMFQQLFVPLAVEAITKALEIAIIKGTGTGQPTGITVDSRVPSANKITMAPVDVASWSAWKKMVFAKMKKSYRRGVFLMAQSTFDANIDGMVDANGQPIGRVNYGIDGEEVYRFGGKTVETVEDDILAPFDTASTGDVFAIFVDLSDYAINSNMQMTVNKWVDHDTNEVKNKVMMICDGKLVDPNGVLILKKGTDPAPQEPTE